MTIQTTSPAAPALDKAHRDLKKACQQFDAFFTDLMLKEMRKTVPQSDLQGGSSNQREIFEGMMDQTVADQMSRHGGLGLGQMMYNELAPGLGSAKTPVPGGPKAEAGSGR